MDSIMRNIIEISRCCHQYRNAELEPYGLKSCHASYLLQISENPGISQDTLARLICVNKSNITRQLAVLEENGFVLRKPSETDKRAMSLYPTQKALDLLPQIRQIVQQWADYLLEDLTEDEIALMTKTLAAMKKRAGSWLEAN